MCHNWWHLGYNEIEKLHFDLAIPIGMVYYFYTYRCFITFKHVIGIVSAFVSK